MNKGKVLKFSTINKYGITLRLVEVTDAEFIVKLRTDGKLGRHISPTSASTTDQVNWLEAYKERERSGLEYYFIATDLEGRPWGTTRLSELDQPIFELGSWLFHPDSPVGMAIKADIIAKELGFEVLGFEMCKFDVRKENSKVLKYHLAFKPAVVAENDLNYYFNLDKPSFEKHRNKLIKLL